MGLFPEKILYPKKVNGYVIKPSADLNNVNLINADLFGANLTEADLTEAYLAGANLTDAKLAGANLTDANLTGVKWSNTTCPDGTVTSKGC